LELLQINAFNHVGQIKVKSFLRETISSLSGESKCSYASTSAENLLQPYQVSFVQISIMDANIPNMLEITLNKASIE